MFTLPSRAGNSPSLWDSYRIQQGEPTFFPFLFASHNSNHQTCERVRCWAEGWTGRIPLAVPLGTQGVIAVSLNFQPPDYQSQNKFVACFFLSLFCFPATCVLDRALFGRLLTTWKMNSNSKGVTLDYCWDLCKEKIININVMVVVAFFLLLVYILIHHSGQFMPKDKIAWYRWVPHIHYWKYGKTLCTPN